jgi:hypothetical protein
MADIAAKLGVELAAGDEDMAAEDLTALLMQRAKEAGKTAEEINAAFEE